MVARVALEIALGKEFDYLVPVEMQDQVEPGTRVKIPFGNRTLIGCVMSIQEEAPEGIALKSILSTIGRPSLVTPRVIELARWISDYYCAPFELTLKAMLPQSVRKVDAQHKAQLYVTPLPGADETKLTARQEAILQALPPEGMLLQDLVKKAETTSATLRKLEARQLVTIGSKTLDRDPYANEVIIPNKPLELNAEQATAMETIKEAFGSGSSRTFLLHGVTGSGKTEIYLQAIAHALERGAGAIVLVPEISLTPQTVERFKARFSHGHTATQVAVLHSHLSSGERHDEWHKIRQGRARIVIGARSAIFAPLEPLGLIIVDEEHEHSYKQEETPRYHARDLAVVRGQMEKAVVVLGSATPSMESYNNVERKKYQLLELLQRVDDKKMPLVRVVDMRMEARKDKGTPMFGTQLKEAITRRLLKKEQVILFLNRRGYATSLQCPLCGYVAECPNCSVTLTYHYAAKKLCCHICGHEAKAPSLCPEEKCRNPQIRYAGLGTEKVELTLQKLFPRARLARMDSDTLHRKEDYRRILGDFRTGKIDILVGTQMIAKGLHFPNVTLVGIVHADISLHVPDFRAAERTFQLLTQVAGRSGRGDVEGEVFIQSYTPFHPSIQFARRHDFLGFYDQEMEFRKQLKYPPFARVALLTMKGRNEEKVSFLADHIKKLLTEKLARWSDLIIAGPAPAPLARAETFYRYQIMLRTPHMLSLSRELRKTKLDLALPEDVSLTIDIDPVNLF